MSFSAMASTAKDTLNHYAKMGKELNNVKSSPSEKDSFFFKSKKEYLINELGDTVFFRFTPPESDTIIVPSVDTTEIKKTSKFMNFIESTSRFFAQDTSKHRKVSFLAIPEISYSESEGIGLGGTGRIYINNYNRLPNGNKPRQSFIDASFNFTFKGSFSLAIRPELYFKQDKLLIRGHFGVGHYPSSFWGIGPDTTDDMEESYNKNNFITQIFIYWHFLHHSYVGVGAHYYDNGISDINPDGQLSKGDITGSTGGKISGLSAHYMYDTRDYQFVPLKGVYIQADAYFNAKVFGSSENFTRYVFDIRYYWSLGKNSVLALNWYSQISFGEVPFQDMQGVSNGVHTRGYSTKRYIDRNLMSTQIEYRHYFGRFGVACFASCGGVGPDVIKALKMDKASFGGGFRIKPFKGQRMYFRADIGINIKGQTQFYLGLDELF
ncbi:MAG: BamA/TamA family outer membrane protein [Flavobacteriales bacterium]|nr:BamA/TamA family outer membrane protein [Flavobacteriales bacterium]